MKANHPDDAAAPSTHKEWWATVAPHTRLQVKPAGRQAWLPEVYVATSLREAIQSGAVEGNWSVCMADNPANESSVAAFLDFCPAAHKTGYSSTGEHPGESVHPEWVVALVDWTLPLAVIYSGVSAVLIILMVPFALFRYALPVLPLIAGLSAAALATAAVGFHRRRRWSRRLFLISAPWGPVALALVYKDALWTGDRDFALTWLLVLAYGVLALLLSRRNTIEALGCSGVPSWSTRGGIVLGWGASSALVFAFLLGSKSGVMLMNVIWMLAVQYTLGLLLVSIPSPFIIRSPQALGATPAETPTQGQHENVGTMTSTQGQSKLGKPMVLVCAAVLAFGLAYPVRYSGEGVAIQSGRGGRTMTLDDTVAFFRAIGDHQHYQMAKADLRNRRIGSALLMLAGIGCGIQAVRVYRRRRMLVQDNGGEGETAISDAQNPAMPGQIEPAVMKFARETAEIPPGELAFFISGMETTNRSLSIADVLAALESEAIHPMMEVQCRGGTCVRTAGRLREELRVGGKKALPNSSKCQQVSQESPDNAPKTAGKRDGAERQSVLPAAWGHKLKQTEWKANAMSRAARPASSEGATATTKRLTVGFLAIGALVFTLTGCAISTTYGRRPLLVSERPDTYQIKIYKNAFESNDGADRTADAEIRKLLAETGFNDYKIVHVERVNRVKNIDTCTASAGAKCGHALAQSPPTASATIRNRQNTGRNRQELPVDTRLPF